MCISTENRKHEEQGLNVAHRMPDCILLVFMQRRSDLYLFLVNVSNTLLIVNNYGYGMKELIVAQPAGEIIMVTGPPDSPDLTENRSIPMQH